MLMKRWTVMICALLAAFVLASCGNQKDTSGETTASALTEGPGTETVSVTEEPAGTSTEPASGGEEGKDGDTNGGDFVVTGKKWEWVYWDGNEDGKEEQISFEYNDNGDEAASYILVKLEVGGSSEAFIDRAGRIVRIFDMKDEEGPYLLVEYNYENRLTEEADMQCIVRLRDGELVVEEVEK